MLIKTTLSSDTMTLQMDVDTGLSLDRKRALHKHDPGVVPPDLNYTFESIDVPGVEFLAVTASSDFEDYAGNMRSADSEKDVGFTLIDGVFYDL